MKLKTETFFKNRIFNYKLSIFFASTFSILIMGILSVIYINYDSINRSLKENVSYNLVLSDSVPETQIQQMIKSLVLMDSVKSVNFLSKQNSADNLISDLGQDFLSLLGYNPLSNIIEVKFFADYFNTIDIVNKMDEFSLYTEVESVVYDKDIIDIIEKYLEKLSIILSVFAIFFLLVAFTLINSNIRLTIYSERFRIKTMQLVGATKKFIQKPFILSNLTITVVACFVGNTFLASCIYFLTKNYEFITNLITVYDSVLIFVTTSFVNLFISFFSTWIFVRKYLNLKTDDLYK